LAAAASTDATLEKIVLMLVATPGMTLLDSDGGAAGRTHRRKGPGHRFSEQAFALVTGREISPKLSAGVAVGYAAPLGLITALFERESQIRGHDQGRSFGALRNHLE
jgi:hypothetical protein